MPPPGCGYELAAAPKLRAGITIDAPFDSATIRGNRIWDNHDDQTQTHGLWITERGSCVDCRVEDNDLAGNADERDATGHPAGGRTLAGQPRGQRLELSGRPAGSPRPAAGATTSGGDRSDPAAAAVIGWADQPARPATGVGSSTTVAEPDWADARVGRRVGVLGDEHGGQVRPRRRGRRRGRW